MLCPQNAPNQASYAFGVLCHRALEGSSAGIRVVAALLGKRYGTPRPFFLVTSDHQRCRKHRIEWGATDQTSDSGLSHVGPQYPHDEETLGRANRKLTIGPTKIRIWPHAVSIAQLVEHWIVVPVVTGSSPVTHPLFSCMGQSSFLWVTHAIDVLRWRKKPLVFSLFSSAYRF